LNRRAAKRPDVLVFFHLLSRRGNRNFSYPGTLPRDAALFILFCEVIMRLFSRIVAIATAPILIGIHAAPAAAQSFNDRWSIIPQAHTEPAPEAPRQTDQPPQQQFQRPPQQQSQQQPQEQAPTGSKTPRRSEAHAVARSFNRMFSGKASYYSYRAAKTAEGLSFDRDLLTAAHRSLPFGSKVRVTDVATNKSVVVRITDRGPKIRGRVLDLSLGAARSLGIVDRGVVQVRAEVL
jgi:peptidoglycan lytic transglycosylase